MAFAECSASCESCIPGIRSSPSHVSSPPTASSRDAASVRAGSSPARSAGALPSPPMPSGTWPPDHRRIGPVLQAGYIAPPRSDPICSGRCWPATARSLRPAGSRQRLSHRPVLHHSRFQPLPDQLQYLRSETRSFTNSIRLSLRMLSKETTTHYPSSALPRTRDYHAPASSLPRTSSGGPTASPHARRIAVCSHSARR